MCAVPQLVSAPLNIYMNEIDWYLSIIFFPGPGEIRFSLNFNRERQTLIAHIGDIRDVKLPAGQFIV